MNRMRSSLLGSSDQTNHQDCHQCDTRQQQQQQPKYLYTNDSNKQHIIQQQNQEKETLLQQVISSFQSIIRQVPSIILIGLFHLMIGIPFGVSYFPIEWTNNESSLLSTDDDDSSRDSIHGGRFPDIPGVKEFTSHAAMTKFNSLLCGTRDPYSPEKEMGEYEDIEDKKLREKGGSRVKLCNCIYHRVS